MTLPPLRTLPLFHMKNNAGLLSAITTFYVSLFGKHFSVWQPGRQLADPAAFVRTWAAAPCLVSAGTFTCEPEKPIWQPRVD